MALLTVAVPVPNPDGAAVGTGSTTIPQGRVTIGESSAAPSLRRRDLSEANLKKRGVLGFLFKLGTHIAAKKVDPNTTGAKEKEIYEEIVSVVGPIGAWKRDQSPAREKSARSTINGEQESAVASLASNQGGIMHILLSVVKEAEESDVSSTASS
ncbi:hypothetical protein FRB91_001351 [Serendipita sp. 411]|nr:hypothetical protein FRB91_001351 [Serendipita sp. 411]